MGLWEVWAGKKTEKKLFYLFVENLRGPRGGVFFRQKLEAEEQMILWKG